MNQSRFWLFALMIAIFLSACGNPQPAPTIDPAASPVYTGYALPAPTVPTNWMQSDELSAEENVISFAEFNQVRLKYTTEENILGLVSYVDDGEKTGFYKAEFHEGILFMYYKVDLADHSDERINSIGDALAECNVGASNLLVILEETTYGGGDDHIIPVAGILTVPSISDEPCLATFGEYGVVYVAK